MRRATVNGFLGMLLSVMLGSTSAAFAGTALSLDSIAPSNGPYTGGTPVVVTGDFTGADEQGLSAYITQSEAPDPLRDRRMKFVSAAATALNAITPPNLPAPGSYQVYVVEEGGAPSNMIAFNLTPSNETPVEVLARTLEQNFAVFDVNNDGLIDADEASVWSANISGEFDEIDTNDDGFLSPAELTVPRSECSCATPWDRIQMLILTPFLILLAFLVELRELLLQLFGISQ